MLRRVLMQRRELTRRAIRVLKKRTTMLRLLCFQPGHPPEPGVCRSVRQACFGLSAKGSVSARGPVRKSRRGYRSGHDVAVCATADLAARGRNGSVLWPTNSLLLLPGSENSFQMPGSETPFTVHCLLPGVPGAELPALSGLFMSTAKRAIGFTATHGKTTGYSSRTGQ